MPILDGFIKNNKKNTSHSRSNVHIVMPIIRVSLNIVYTLFPGSIPKKGCRHPLPMPADADVHVRVRLLPAQEQPVSDIRG